MLRHDDLGQAGKSMPYNNSFQLWSHKNHHQMNITIRNDIVRFIFLAHLTSICVAFLSNLFLPAAALNSPVRFSDIGFRRQIFSYAAPEMLMSRDVLWGGWRDEE